MQNAGHYPEWDEQHPIHFVGHSAGAQVVRVLQQMLAADKVRTVIYLDRVMLIRCKNLVHQPVNIIYTTNWVIQTFPGYDNTNENWVLSLTSLSGALNGSTRAYMDGMR